MNLSVYEILENVDKEKTKAKKIKLLQEHRNVNAVKVILDFTFNPNWKWLLPEGNPPYNSSPKEHDLQHVLKADFRKLQYFVNTKEGAAIKPLRRETMFIEMLESVDFYDAKLLLSIKEKKMPFKSITKKLVMEAFPDETKHWS